MPRRAGFVAGIAQCVRERDRLGGISGIPRQRGGAFTNPRCVDTQRRERGLHIAAALNIGAAQPADRDLPRATNASRPRHPQRDRAMHNAACHRAQRLAHATRIAAACGLIKSLISSVTPESCSIAAPATVLVRPAACPTPWRTSSCISGTMSGVAGSVGPGQVGTAHNSATRPRDGCDSAPTRREMTSKGEPSVSLIATSASSACTSSTRDTSTGLERSATSPASNERTLVLLPALASFRRAQAAWGASERHARPST